jgi:hypothetical protein
MYHSNVKHPVLNYSRIPFINEKAHRVFRKRIDAVSDFKNLHTLHLQDDITQYPLQVDRFDYPEKADALWQHFISRKPQEMWSGELVKFLFAYSKSLHQPCYCDDADPPSIHEGMQFYCLLNLAGPVGVVGMEVMKIDEQKKWIELAYIEGGIYRGLQRLEFVAQLSGSTRIIHTSYYKAENLLGRLLPYRFFHKKTVREFHQNMKNLLSQS